jgi:hypothetical protein
MIPSILQKLFRPTVTVVATLLAVSFSPCIGVANEVIVIAKTGDLAPGLAPDKFFGAVGYGFLNDRGDVSFSGGVTDEASFGLHVANAGWLHADGQTTPKIISEQPAAGLPAGAIYSSGLSAILWPDNRGGFATLHSAGLPGDGRNRDAIWFDNGNGVQLASIEHGTAPGMPSNFGVDRYERMLYGTNGDLAFSALLDSDVNDSVITGESGLWHGRSTIEPVALEGMPVAGMTPGVQYDYVYTASGVNGRGDVLFPAHLTGPGIVEANNHAIFLHTAEGLQKIVQRGTIAPDSGGATFFSLLFSEDAGLNDNRQVVFKAELAGSGVTANTNTGIYLSSGGTLRKVIRGGDPSPIPGSTFGAGVGGVVVNANGETAFVTNISIGNETVVWSEGFGGMHIVARSSAQPPGLPAGQPFDILYPGMPLVMNAAGQVAFASGFDGSGPTGIWAQDRNRELHLIAHVNHEIEFGPGDLRTISSITLFGHSGSQDGRLRWFNDRGQVAFGARFYDGSYAVLISNLVAVPEPGALALGAMSVLGCLIRRTRSARRFVSA